jgi:hypothetical protein
MFPSYFNIFVSFVALCSKNKSSKRPFAAKQNRTLFQTINGHKNPTRRARGLKSRTNVLSLNNKNMNMDFIKIFLFSDSVFSVFSVVKK